MGSKGVKNTRLSVDGDPGYMKYYRTKLGVIIATINEIKSLISPTLDKKQNITGTVWCNNSNVVSKYESLEDVDPRSMKEANSDDIDIIQEL